MPALYNDEVIISALQNRGLTLKDARNLVVRVAGYSAFFNDLSKEIQDDIILRTEHRTLDKTVF